MSTHSQKWYYCTRQHRAEMTCRRQRRNTFNAGTTQTNPQASISQMKMNKTKRPFHVFQYVGRSTPKPPHMPRAVFRSRNSALNSS